MPELTLEVLQAELTTSNEKIKADVKALVDEGSTKNEEEKVKLATLIETIAVNDKNLKDYQEQINQKIASFVPGMEDAVKEFDMGAYARTICKSTPNHPNYVGNNVEAQWAGAEKEKEMVEAQRAISNKSNNSDDGSQGGFLVPTELRNEIIDLVIPQMPIMDMGATVLTGLTSDVKIPKLTGRPTGYMVGEEVAPTESSATFGDIELRPRKAGAWTKMSNRLIFQTKGTASAIIKREIANALVILFNNQMINGSGADSEARGLLQHSANFTSNNVSIGTNGGRFKFDHAAEMVLALQTVDEATAIPESGYLMRPEALSGLNRQTIKQYSGQADADGQPLLGINPLVTDAVLESALKAKLRYTTQLSATETTGTSATTSKVIYGDWRQMYIAFFNDMVLRASDQAGNSGGSAFTQDQMWFVAFQEFDCNVGRAAAFTQVAGAETDSSEW